MAELGLIAGNGPLPVLVAREARARGVSLVAVGHVGETWEELEQHVARMIWVRVGELGVLIHALREAGLKQVMMLGGIDKQRALKDLKIDERGWRLLRKLSARGDDTLLGALARELEDEGIRVVGSQEWLAPWLAPSGPMTARQPTAQERKDIRLGVEVLVHLGALDIGQAVVVKEGVILALEAVEGTDQAVLRGGKLGGAGTVVVKGSKPQQDMRFDVPVVGLGTIRSMLGVGSTVLALETGRTLLLDREEMLRVADSEGICLWGWTRQEELHD